MHGQQNIKILKKKKFGPFLLGHQVELQLRERGSTLRSKPPLSQFTAAPTSNLKLSVYHPEVFEI